MLLERYYLTKLPFSCIPVNSWMDIEGFISYCQIEHVPPLIRQTLLSDGSLVKSLRALYLSEISVEVKDQKDEKMGIEMAKFLDCREGLDAIIRDAWLFCSGKKLVYAHSFIDASEMGEMIQKEIHKKIKPVGILLDDYSLPLVRDQLFITLLRSDYLCREFCIAENTFYARCYRLRGGEGFKAAILEIFSPLLFGSEKYIGTQRATFFASLNASDAVSRNPDPELDSEEGEAKKDGESKDNP